MARGWGRRRSVARDYVFDDTVQLGEQRLGPDLANYGERLGTNPPPYLRLYCPQTLVSNSVCAPSPFLFRKQPKWVVSAELVETTRLYATKLLGAPDGDWRVVGCDPEGLDLQLERIGLRLPFPQRVAQPGALRAVLKQMAEQARAA